MEDLDTMSVVLSEGMNYVAQVNTIYVKALADASEMLGVALKVTKEEATLMILGDNFFRLQELVKSMAAVQVFTKDAISRLD